MSPDHHPSIDILVAYASGVLEPGFGLAVAAHIEFCATCRTQVAALEATSGDALRDLPPVELASDALDRVLRRLEAPPTAPTVDTRPLWERLSLKRRRWVAPGVWAAAVDTPHAPADRVYLLSVGPGMRTVRHHHSGAEFCTVLKGAYRDEFGRFAAGDFVAAYGEAQHQPVVDDEAGCLCFFATEGRLRPHSLLGRAVFALADV